MPALTAMLRPVSSRTIGTRSSSRCMVRSSGPRTARTMQNSEAPTAAVSRAAASTSSVSRNGVAFTGVSKRGRLAAEVAVLGAAAGLDRQDALDLDLGAAPREADLVGERGERRHRLVGDPGEHGELVGGEEAPVVEQRLLGVLQRQACLGRVERGLRVAGRARLRRERDWLVRGQRHAGERTEAPPPPRNLAAPTALLRHPSRVLGGDRRAGARRSPPRTAVGLS